MSPNERMRTLVIMVGGPSKAAAIAGVTRTSIDNYRKPGHVLPLLEIAALCTAADVSLDWLAHGADAVAAAGLSDSTVTLLTTIAEAIDAHLRQGQP